MVVASAACCVPSGGATSQVFRRLPSHHLCLSRTPHRKSRRVHVEWCRTTDSLVEFPWNCVRPALPRKKKHSAQKNEVMVLDGHILPDKPLGVLELEPKFCFEPQISVLDNLALSGSIFNRVLDQERPSCQKFLVSALSQFPDRHRSSGRLNPLVDYFVQNNLRLVQPDK
ncbi:hypothetical protein HPB50_026494 [Hyalomma asiaticum]|uniref:Uncharacterized protein n=1 Tax=Hyalomma asiaticum TaxID=266040 RepID=A0ACB7SXC2_HYAAI|nr:hypothetical protein HPB50_026494 [Hyalomma asiaticum]